MEQTEKINLRGAINALEVGAPPLELPKSLYKISVVRTSAATVTGDTGKKFTVSSTDTVITVNRLS